jgi:hypothetical protein
MSVRFALALLLSVLFCFPCYASSALSASPSNALMKGYEIPELPKSDRYLDYAIVKNTISFSTNKDYADYILFAFYSSPVVTYGGYGFDDKELHFSGHLNKDYDGYLYSLSLGQWVKLDAEWGLLNIYDLERDSVIMSTSTIVYQDRLKVFYYYFPVTITFEQQPMFSDLIQLIYRVVISLIVVIVLIISVRIILKLIYRVAFFYLRKGVL